MLETYKNILVGLDGSTQSDRALQEAVEVAKRNAGKLFIAHVVDDNKVLFNSAAPASEVFHELQEEARIEIEHKLAAFDFKNVELVCVVGNPKKALASDIPKKYAIDLIMIGATGKHAIERTLVGSTTAYVVNHAPCNVMVIK